MKYKKWYESKTLWINTIIIIIGFIIYIIEGLNNGVAISFIVLGILNDLLRLISDSKIDY